METNEIAAMLPVDANERKQMPMATGLLDYFPLALAEVARVSKVGNDQHNPGQPLHWARGKSMDHPDCIVRHLVDRGTRDPLDGQRHSAKLAWRALALLEEELEAEGAPLPRGAKVVEPAAPAGPKPLFVCPGCGTNEPWSESTAVKRPEYVQRHPGYHPPCNTSNCIETMVRT